MRLRREIYHKEKLNLNGKIIERKAVRGIIRKNEKVLMIYSPVNGDYKFPGGGIEKDETKEDALIREIEEECGLKKTSVRKEWGKIIEYSEAKEKEYNVFMMTSYYYSCSVNDEQFPQKLDKYENELQFVPKWIALDQAIENNKKILSKNNPPKWTKRDTTALILLKSERKRMLKKAKVILFDLDGTITDPKIGITKSVQYALKENGIVENDLEHLKKFIGPPLGESFKKYYKFKEENIHDVIGSYREYFKRDGIYENELYKNTLSTLKKLSKEYTLTIATSKPTIFAEKIVDYFKLNQYFDKIIGSNLNGSRSSKTEIIKYCMEIYKDVPAENILMIGDREHDIIGAKNNMISSIGVLYGYGNWEELENAGADYFIDDISDLTEVLN